MNEIEICLQCTLDDCRPQSAGCGLRRPVPITRTPQQTNKPDRREYYRNYYLEHRKRKLAAANEMHRRAPKDRREYFREYQRQKYQTRKNQPKPTEVIECTTTPHTADAENARPQNGGK